jgi:hypothetical protein
MYCPPTWPQRTAATAAKRGLKSSRSKIMGLIFSWAPGCTQKGQLCVYITSLIHRRRMESQHTTIQDQCRLLTSNLRFSLFAPCVCVCVCVLVLHHKRNSILYYERVSIWFRKTMQAGDEISIPGTSHFFMYHICIYK